MKTDKLLKKYSPKEVAGLFIFRNKLTTTQKQEAAEQLKKVREKVQKQTTFEQVLLARLLQLKYRIEDYSKSDEYNENNSFSYFLKEYLNSLAKKNKDFANDIGIDETELSQLLNKHRKPSEKIIIRLEIHSNKILPALMWYKLLEKEKEYELSTNQLIRKSESKYVKNRLNIAV